LESWTLFILGIESQTNVLASNKVVKAVFSSKMQIDDDLEQIVQDKL
jgi:hypothetical protein